MVLQLARNTEPLESVSPVSRCLYSNQIGWWIKKQGYTQEEVADAIGIARRTLSNYIAGTRVVPRSYLEKIAATLGCDLEDLTLPSTYAKNPPNDRLKRERELRGLSQADVAEKVGTDQKIVSRWECGVSVPVPYYRQKLCKLFGKTAEELGFMPGAADGVSNTPAKRPNHHLRHVRELRGWSQGRLAEEIGTDEKRIGVWERGESIPSPFFQEKLCNLFGKNAAELGLLSETTTSLNNASSRAFPTLATEEHVFHAFEVVDGCLMVSTPQQMPSRMLCKDEHEASKQRKTTIQSASSSLQANKIFQRK
jgi:transcriptional regulator with XRE-family HTH domain